MARGRVRSDRSGREQVPPRLGNRRRERFTTETAMNVNWNWKAALVGLAIAVPTIAHGDPDLDRALANPDNWAAQAGDEYNQRYSPLKQINAANAKKLQVAW